MTGKVKSTGRVSVLLCSRKNGRKKQIENNKRSSLFQWMYFLFIALFKSHCHFTAEEASEESTHWYSFSFRSHWCLNCFCILPLPSCRGHNTYPPHLFEWGLIWFPSLTWTTSLPFRPHQWEPVHRLSCQTAKAGSRSSSGPLDLTHQPPVSPLQLTTHLRNHHPESKEARPHFLDGPLPESNWRLKCAREKDDLRLHFLITFTGPQSHPRNHGDTDKVTHDYSSAALPDWTAPESFAKRIHQRSLCP